MDAAALYRMYGPAILAACRRQVADDAIAARLTPKVFVRVQQKLGGPDDAMLLARAARDAAVDIPGPRLLRDLAPPTEAELARARDRFTRQVYARTLPIVERDQRPPTILRWLKVYAPVHVALAAMMGIFLAMPNLMRPQGVSRSAADDGLELYAERGGVRLRLLKGMRVRKGDHLRAVVTPAGYPSVTVLAGPRIVQRLEHLQKDAGRIEVDTPIIVEEEAHIRVTAQFALSPRGFPDRATSIELDVE
jgi:hypothetical protein